MNSNIRNFAIIAHVDHGKSTLADRFLELTKTMTLSKIGEQYLDTNPIEKARGITIKLAPVRMNYRFNDKEYVLNLIDTPGHVDFSYEVSRTLAACEGAILLVDATQGVQAQTVAHFFAAQKEGLTIIPVINKIDLQSSKTEEVVKELEEIFGIKKEEIIYISAKTGQNVPELLKAVVEKIPPPKGLTDSPLRALIFDALYDEHRGVIVYVRVVDGTLPKNGKITFFQSEKTTNAGEIGCFTPLMTPRNELIAGEIGYIVTGIKDIHETQVGDTICLVSSGVDPLPGYKKPQPMVFFGVYPKTTDELVNLKEGLNKYALNDTSITIATEYSSFLGNGFRVGFLGLLHADIVRQRLREEENVDLFLTSPQVLYEKKENGDMLEPYMNLTIFVPSSYVGGVISICQQRKGNMLDVSYFQSSAILKYDMPYSMLVRGLSSDLKSTTSGYASIDYEISDYRPADLVNIEIRINDVPVDVLSEYAYRDEAPYIAREKAEKLKEKLPRQQFRQVIQAIIGGNIIAREEISAYKKDVLMHGSKVVGGGDVTRKKMLLEKQKKGKERMTETGKVTIPQEVLFSLIEK
ncbi:MAG: translation elongation factor 4 [Candidatus Levybacteria bacterium]|nr:translation elongation factor 4 [Candidatus Levybacteria bacterium]